MSQYQAPLREMRFALNEIGDLDEIASLPAFAEATPDLADAVLEAAAKFAAGVLSPPKRGG